MQLLFISVLYSSYIMKYYYEPANTHGLHYEIIWEFSYHPVYNSNNIQFQNLSDT